MENIIERARGWLKGLPDLLVAIKEDFVEGFYDLRDQVLDLPDKIRNIDWFQALQPVLLFILILALNFSTISREILTQADYNLTPEFERLDQLASFYLGVAFIGLLIFVVKNITVNFVLKFTAAYLIYLPIAYFIVAARNLNNKSFDFWDFGKNHFLQVNVLPFLLAVFAVAALIRYLAYRFEFEPVIDHIESDRNFQIELLSVLLGTIVINNHHLLENDRLLLGPLAEAGDYQTFISQLLSDIFWALLLSIWIGFMVIRSLEALKRNQASLALVFSTSLVLAIIFNYSLQFGVKADGQLLGRYIFSGATSFQILFLIACYLFLYLVINRYLLTTIIIIALGIVLSVVNAIKQSMRSEPLLVTDLAWLSELDLVASFVQGPVVLYLVIGLASLVAFYHFFGKKLLTNPPLKLWGRIIGLLVLFSLTAPVVNAFKYENNSQTAKLPKILSGLESINVDWMGFSANARYKSLAYVWLKQMMKPIMPKPDGYSKEAVEAVADKYQQLAQEMNQIRTANISDQTVIYLLSESLSNPSRISGVTISENVLKNIDAIKDKTTSGLMYSDGYGGGTANMEFQSLLGFPMDNYSSSASVLYSDVFPKLSKIPSISDFYESQNKFVLHPSGANNYNRKNVYKTLGFEHLIFSEGSDETFENPVSIGVSVSDQTVYDTILSKLDSEQSQFFSVITMQNHSPWSVGKPVEVVAHNSSFTAGENGALTEYARLLSYTDQATADFLSQLTSIEKDITVVFYGDHLPGLYPASVFESNPDSQYETDYFIWSNHQENKLVYDKISPSDFASILLAHTNSKVSPYYALLTSVLDNQINNLEEGELTDTQAEILNDLKLIQYDVLLGDNYIAKRTEFFNIE